MNKGDNTNYHFSDFTETNYRKLLSLAQTRFNFISYDQAFEDKKSNVVIWRHDVDFSIHRALALAKIENELGIKSTFFIHLGSTCYNCFEDEIKEIIGKIILLGHSIGLHFYAQYYGIQSKDELEEKLLFEQNILETILKQKLSVFSFHNPDSKILNNYTEIRYAGLINTYSNFIRDNFAYCSDSNGYWRHERLEDFLLNNESNKIQVLTHPEWWQKEILSPQQRIWRCVDGRAVKTKKWYLDMLKKSERKNVL
jgi:hypothetical protein